jgi:hypothetical protein
MCMDNTHVFLMETSIKTKGADGCYVSIDEAAEVKYTYAHVK